MEKFLLFIIEENLNYTVDLYFIAYMHFGCELQLLSHIIANQLPVDYFAQAIWIIGGLTLCSIVIIKKDITLK